METAMGKFEALIQHYCPDGVKFVPLGSIAVLSRGKVISKDYIKDNVGDYPVYSSQSENDGVLGRINTYMYEGKYLTWTTDGAYAGTVFRRSGKFNITNVCGLVDVSDQNVNLDFLYYWLYAEAPKYVYRGMGNPKLMSNVMGTISVPIPPLPVQEEIVRVLDTFTELQAELQAELQKRLQQYNYYRDSLLSFEDSSDVEWREFFDVCELVRGITYNKEQEVKNQSENAHKVLRANNITLHLNTLNFDDVKLVSKDVIVKPSQMLYSGDILMCAGSGSKEHVGKVAYISEDMNYSFGGFMAVVRCKATILPRFMFHILTSSSFSNHLEVQINSSTINNINKQVMQSFAVPVPPIPVQERIANLLDRFDTLSSSLSSGLPAEIEKRRQQYEFYRDKLLTFKRKEA